MEMIPNGRDIKEFREEAVKLVVKEEESFRGRSFLVS